MLDWDFKYQMMILTSALEKKIQANGKNNKTSESGVVVVKMMLRSMKEKILSTMYKNKRSIKANLINPSFNGTIYINDWLSYEMKSILREAKVAKKQNNYEFLWVRRGRIMMRRAAGTKVVFIRKLEDFKELSVTSST